jgi:hypothetical protein
MKNHKKEDVKRNLLTRRDFLCVAGMTPLAMGVASALDTPFKGNSSKKSRVVLVRDKKALISFKKPDPNVVQRMLDLAVKELLGENDPVEAWKKLIKPSDIVGIKSNVWHYLPTGAEVEQALKRRIMDAGVAEENIGINDREVRDIPFFKRTTALVNARPGRTHHWSGIGGCIKNPIMFSTKPKAYHGDYCADLAKIWDLPLVKDKVRLNVLIMLTPLFHGIGPHHYSDKYVWEYKGILVSQDPVAIDAVGVRILQAKRRQFFGEERPLQPPAKHIVLADTRHNLGTSDPNKIELIKLGWQEEILI